MILAKSQRNPLMMARLNITGRQELQTLSSQNSKQNRLLHSRTKFSFLNTPVSHLISAYSATEFLLALQSFLKEHMPNSLNPNQFDCFDIYNAVSILLPSRPHVSDRHETLNNCGSNSRAPKWPMESTHTSAVQYCCH